MKKRILGVDILKILSMLMIITLHVLGKGSLLTLVNNFTLKGEVIWIIEILCYCSVNCYALASGYTGISSRSSKLSKIIHLWIQVVFYSVLGEFIYILLNPNDTISIVNIIKSFFPIITSKYWYFTAYFGMFFLLPILNGIIKKFEKEMLKRSCISILFIFCVMSSFKNIETLGLISGYSLLWLSVLYLIGAYLKEFNVFENYSRHKLLLGYFLCSFLVWISKLMIGLLTNAIIGEVKFDTVFVDYNNILIVFASICLLGFFVQTPINEKYERVIGVLSMHTFGVYIIHQTPVIYAMFSGKFENFVNYNVFFMVILIILSSVMIFLLCLCIDLFRHKLFHILKVNEICLFISCKIENVFDCLLKI